MRATARSTNIVNVGHLPRATVSSCAVDELRCKVNFSVVRPRVVFWVVLERTGRLVDVRLPGRARALLVDQVLIHNAAIEGGGANRNGNRRLPLKGMAIGVDHFFSY